MINFFTTINPYSNFEAQDEALRSWAKYYKVYSVNTSDEIELVKDKYPYINFISTDNIFKSGNKKLVKLDAILDSIKTHGGIYNGIINSDIILGSKLNLKGIGDDLLISTRWELDGDKVYPFGNGYDLFIFHVKLCDLFKNKNYVIGMPWWDFWVPLITLRSGLSVKHIKNRKIFHRTHPTNYDNESWISFGEHLYRDIFANLMKVEINADIFNFCEIVKKYIEMKQINIKI